jgi:hypothetical protein
MRRGGSMHIVAIHAISDPQTFWGAAEGMDLPEGTSLHSAIPNEDGTRAVCVWESDSVDTVRDFVDGSVGQVSKNEFFAVNEQNAMGLPGATSAAAR